MTDGKCVFKHNGPDGKPMSAPFVYIDEAGNIKEVCSSHFVVCVESEVKALRKERQLETLEKLRKERLEELKNDAANN